MIWATLRGYLLFGDFPDWTTGAGAALVIGAASVCWAPRAGTDRADSPAAGC